MKLSEKGLKRFNHLYWEEDEQLHEIEFELDDFEGVVVLSVEEAKDISHQLNDLAEGFFLETGNIHSKAVEWHIVLDDKIEQSEKQ